MKRLINICLLLCFLAGYLEWGRDNHLFIFEGEAELFVKAQTNPTSILHPFILIPLLGQLIIVYTLFQKTPGRILSLTGLACLSTIMLFLFFIGIITPNIKILVFATPFLITGIFVLRYHRKIK